MKFMVPNGNDVSRTPTVAARMLERAGARQGLLGRGRRDAVPVRPQDGSAVLLQDLALEGIDGKPRVHAAEVGREHVRIGLLAPLLPVGVATRSRAHPAPGGTFAARKEQGEADTMPNAPLASALCTAVATSDGFV